MKENQAVSILLKRLWRHISPRRRRQFGLLLVLMIIASFAEVLSIGSVLPFLGVLTSPESIYDLPITQPFIQILALSEPSQLLLPLTILFCFAALLAGGLRVMLLWASTKLSYATGADLSLSIYRRTLYQPFLVHNSRNSSEVINGISNKTSAVIYVITMVLTFISSVVILLTILITLISVDPLIAISAFGGFGFIYGVVIRVTRRRLSSNSKAIADQSTRVIKTLQEGLGGIRDVLIDGSQSAYCLIYRNADRPLRQAQASSSFISISPRYVMEALGMILIGILAFIMARDNEGITKAIPVLGALALGAQRLLPVLQQLYAACSVILANQASLKDALELLDQPMPTSSERPSLKKVPFHNSIVLKKLDFQYGIKGPFVLRNLNLVITKGSRVGFIGSTGSGKSTLLDIVMGLLQPSNGRLEIDGTAINCNNNCAWQAHIAHVPQTIFLTDSSIEENIAFGVPKDQIDKDRVRQAAKQAQIADVIDSWPEQYETFVGERGVRLSGGQRQRIGIARALYKQADVIIFDEATSALDDETEQAVMRAIETLSKDLTILIVAHRLTTLKNATHIVELHNGSIARVGSYKEIVINHQNKKLKV